MEWLHVAPCGARHRTVVVNFFMERRQRKIVFGLVLLVALTAGASSGVVASILLSRSLGDYAAELLRARIPLASSSGPSYTNISSADDALTRIADVASQSIAVVLPSTIDTRSATTWVAETDAAGYGVVVATDGWVLVTDAVRAQFGNMLTQADVWVDGTRYAVTQVIADDLTDFVLVKIAANGLTPVAFGASDEVQTGGTVYAARGAQGVLVTTFFNGRVIDGVPAAPAEQYTFHWTLAQMPDVTSPVFASSGELLALADMDSAFPIHTGSAFVQSVLRDGVVTHAGVGVTVVDLSLPMNIDHVLAQERRDGALVMTPVLRAGPADVAGILAGDVIVAVDDVRIDRSTTLAEVLRLYRPLDRATFTVVRGGVTVRVDVTLGVYEDLLY